MTRDEMWKAVLENDESYDGIFFYAVKSTGIYCRPSCKSKIPKRENVSFFDTSEQARIAGFRPCKRWNLIFLSFFHRRAKAILHIDHYVQSIKTILNLK